MIKKIILVVLSCLLVVCMVSCNSNDTVCSVCHFKSHCYREYYDCSCCTCLSYYNTYGSRIKYARLHGGYYVETLTGCIYTRVIRQTSAFSSYEDYEIVYDADGSILTYDKYLEKINSEVNKNEK